MDMCEMIGPAFLSHRRVPRSLAAKNGAACFGVAGNGRPNVSIACRLEEKHLSGVLAFVPLGSKPTMSKRWCSVLEKAGGMRAEPPGPPMFQKSVPILRF